MARYIDADKLFTWLDIKNRSKYPIGDAEQYNTLLIYEVFDEIDDAETEDVTPVVHAHWIEKEDCSVVTDIPWSMCSACGEYSLKLPYCAFCGAKMDEKEGQR